MKFPSRAASVAVAAATVAVSTSNAFVVPSSQQQQQRPAAAAAAAAVGKSSRSGSLQMGLLDFFSEDAKKDRDRKKRLAVEEQERLQKAIIDRRKNPELMEEYEQKVQIRRQLRMAGKYDEAAQVVMYDDVEDQTLLNGSSGGEQ